MNIKINNDPVSLGRSAGTLAADYIRATIEQQGQANLLLATGASQLETLKQLVQADDIDWSKVVMFHLDEYIGMSDLHPASFSRYLKERFLEKVSPLKAAYMINGNAKPEKECDRLNRLIIRHPIDVALVGIGENGHLAFNDPPADFDTKLPYIIVELDEKCRRQQLSEGWFETMEEIPFRAISMSIQQILKSKHIICSVPDERKASAVSQCLEGPVSNLCPASILQLHYSCYCFLDSSSAKLLKPTKLSKNGEFKT